MKSPILTLLLLVASAFLTNCAKSSRDNSQYINTAAVCSTPGYVPTAQYGCVPQGNCPMGSGQYGNQCVPASTNYGLTGGYGGSCPVGQVPTMQYGCLPQSSNCPPNYGYANGSCYAMATNNYGGASYGGYSYGGYSYGGSCPAGQVKTSIGCLPQQSCPAGYGYSYGNYQGQMGAWCYAQIY